MPYYTGVDPRWYEFQRNRWDSDFSDIMQAIAMRDERDRRRAMDAVEVFNQYPEMVDSDYWQDWVEKYGSKFPEIAAALPLARARQRQQTSDAATLYRGWIEGSRPRAQDPAPANVDIASIPPMLRDTGPPYWQEDAAAGIDWSLAPEAVKEADRPAMRLPENRMSIYGAMPDEILGDDERLVAAIANVSEQTRTPFLKMLDPYDFSGLSPDVETPLRLMAAGNPEQEEIARSAIEINAGTRMNAAQQASEDRLSTAEERQRELGNANLEERIRHNREMEARRGGRGGAGGGAAAQTATQTAALLKSQMKSIPGAVKESKRWDESRNGYVEIPPEEQTGLSEPALDSITRSIGVVKTYGRKNPNADLPLPAESNMTAQGVLKTLELAKASMPEEEAEAVVQEYFDAVANLVQTTDPEAREHWLRRYQELAQRIKGFSPERPG